MTVGLARVTSIVLVALLLVASCGAEEPWVARTDLIEVPLGGERVAIDVTLNDTIPSNAQLISPPTTSPDLELTAESNGTITARSLGGASGDEHMVAYRVTNGDRVVGGTLIVRFVGRAPTPELVVDAAQVDLGAVPVGATSTARLGVAVVGTAGEAHDIVVANVIGDAVTVDAGACRELTESRPCTVDVRWSPTEPGDLDGSFVLDVAGLDQVRIDVTGTATVTAFAATPTEVSLGTVTVGDTPPTGAVTIRNTGTMPIRPTIVSQPDVVVAEFGACATVAVGGECTFELRLPTDRTVDASGTLQIAVADGGSVSIVVTGAVVEPAPPSFELTPGSITIAGRSGSELITVVNTGERAIDGFRAVGHPEWVSVEFGDECAVLDAGRSCPMTVGHDRDEGTPIDDVTVSVETQGAARDLLLTVEPLIESFVLEPPEIQLTRGRSAGTIAVTNDGETTLPEPSLPADTPTVVFLNATCLAPLAPGDRCEFRVAVTETALLRAPIQETGVHDVVAGDLARSLVVAVDVTRPPDFELDPDRVFLPDDGASATITVRNLGGEPLDGLVVTGLTGFGDSGDGVLTVTETRCEPPIDPGTACTFDLRLDDFPTSSPPTVDIEVASRGVTRTITVRLYHVVV